MSASRRGPQYPIQVRLGMPKTRPDRQTAGELELFSAQKMGFRKPPGRFLFPCFPRFPESPDKRKGRSRFRELVTRDSEHQLQVQCPCDTVDAK